MIMAITDFQATLGQCGFEYNWDFMSNYSNLTYAIVISASIPSTKPPYVSAAKCGLNYTHSTLFFIKTWQCPSPYFYFNLTTNLCQDACSPYYYENTTTNSCDSCYYACIDCSTGAVATVCTQCETGLNRYLVNGSCLCASGYFDDWYSPTCRACSAVDTNCLTCSYPYNSLNNYSAIFNVSSWPTDILPDFKCTLCKATYFVNSSYLCQSCPLNYCTLCATLTRCQTCDSSVNATLSTNGLCYLCNVANCSMCSSDNVCAQCVAGYILSNGICLSCEQACNCGGWILPMLANGSCSTLCGDGFKLGTEKCDDGNTNDHDGCSSTCTIETCNVSCTCDGWVQPWVNQNSSCTTVCGDSLKRGSEECDDGNTNDNDGCSSTCFIEGCNVSCLCDGWTSPWANGLCSSICGDNFLRGIQQCDDGNTNDHDGCSSTCQLESCNVSCLCDGWTLPWLTWPTGSCSPICGDGLLRGSEECDDGNTNDHGGCSSTCTNQSCNVSCLCDGWTQPFVNESCSTVCGDSLLRGTETCDDGNVFDHDGCSSTCQIEACDDNCSCDGWTFPWLNGACTPICGDYLLRGSEQCDNGNTNDHDGCSSKCQNEPCNVSCLCDGWIQPWVNESCITVCGDGLQRGNQQCDDGNSDDFDLCQNNCTFPFVPQNQNFVLLSSSISTYPALFLFALGFRIVGLEALNVFQSFQLLLFSESVDSFVLSFNVHGYSDPTYFPLEIPAQNHIFAHFNFMYILIVGLFMGGSALQIYFKSCARNNKIKDSFDPNKETDEKTDKKGTEIGSEEQNSDEFGDFTVHYEGVENIKSYDKSHHNLSQIHQQTQEQQTKPFWGSVLFRQVFFDLVINCQCVFVYTFVGQINEGSLDAFLNFPTFVTIVSMLFVLAIIMAVFMIDDYAFGENDLKFNKDEAILYWALMLGEKIVFAAVLGAKTSCGIYAVLGAKFLLIIYYTYANIYFEKIQKMRSVATHILHLLLIFMVVINEKYFKPQNILTPVTQFFMEYVYFALLCCVLIICFVFYIREFMNKCEADFRKDHEEIVGHNDTEIAAVFDIKQEQAIQESFHAFNLSEMKTSGILEDLQSKKLIQKSSIQLQAPYDHRHSVGTYRQSLSIKELNHLKSHTSNFYQEDNPIKSHKNFQNHRKSHLRQSKLNIFDNSIEDAEDQIKIENDLNIKDEVKDNLQEIQETQNQNRSNNDEKTVENETKLGENPSKTNQKRFIKSNKRIALRNKRSIQAQKKYQKKANTQNQLSFSSTKIEKSSPAFCSTGSNIPQFSSLKMKLKMLNTFSHNKKKYVVKKASREEQKLDVQNLNIKSFDHTDIHDSLDDAVSINLE